MIITLTNGHQMNHLSLIEKAKLFKRKIDEKNLSTKNLCYSVKGSGKATENCDMAFQLHENIDENNVLKEAIDIFKFGNFKLEIKQLYTPHLLVTFK